MTVRNWYDPGMYRDHPNAGPLDRETYRRYEQGAPLTADEVKPLLEAYHKLVRENANLHGVAVNFHNSLASLHKHFAPPEEEAANDGLELKA